MRTHSPMFFMSVFMPSKPTVMMILVFFFTSHSILAQDDLNVLHSRNSNWLHFTDAQNSLYRHLAREAYHMLEERVNEVSEINSLEGWKSRQIHLKKTLHEIIGPFPEKTPLNARITKTIEKDGFRVEHIIYESQPGFFVTSSMYIPERPVQEKKPVVIYCSGHTAEGYRSSVYQRKIINLVHKGFIVFAFDPVGQGERLEYFDTVTGRSMVGGPTSEHSYTGAQAFISGSSLARYMIWDGIRAVDYVLTRGEVDPERIGITGRSGGGTQSSYIAAIDDRIYASAPEAYITSFTRLFQSIGPQDAEQNLFNGIMHGIDHADLLVVRAPKPTLMITTTNDFFSIQGAREAEREVSRIFNAYGKPDNFGRAEDIEAHASTRKNREAMYAFFQKHLNNPGSSVDMDVEILSREDLLVTPTGQISSSLDSETVFSINRRESEALLLLLDDSRKDLEMHLPEVITSAKKLSGYIEPSGKEGEPVFTGRISRDDYLIEKYFIKGEGDYVIPYLLLIPQQPNSKVVLYLHPSGKSAEAGPGDEIEWFVRRGYTVIAPDLLGIGETGPGVFRGDSYLEGISYNVWFASVLTGRSIAGIRAGDIARLAWFAVNMTGIDEVYALAKGELVSELLHAAVFEPSIKRIALFEPYSSYGSIVMNRMYNPRFIQGSVPGALTKYDLPDLAGALAPRRLLLVNVVDAAVESTMKAETDKDLSVVEKAYNFRNAPNSLLIRSGDNNDEFLNEWLK
jgi:pimeloyl-ACP methyl ester carboxylesterase